MSGLVLKRRALKIHQHPNIPLYLFTLAAEEINQVADVARISRDEAGKLIGYQRPEKKQHVRQILEYLDSDEVLFPNSLILALPNSVRFRSSPGPAASDGLATSGTLEIRLPESPGEPRPAWIVDGQQRSLALARTRHNRLPVTVAGFVTEDLTTQRDQFLRVNTVSPLPSNLVSELLPEVWMPLPAKLSARKLPSALVDVLNQDADSPLRGMIKRASTKTEDRSQAVIKDNSLMTAIEESLNSSAGVLFLHRNLLNNTTDTAAILRVLATYWAAVRDTFPNAWGLPPTKSRLMHGVGIRAMGRLMDRVMANVDVTAEDAVERTCAELALIKGKCCWTHGRWQALNVNWNELQNTPRHISTLSNYLIREYVQTKAKTS
ncbi:DGQHR domain-containing protein [Thermobifida halotolerans]|uniref:DGQHR domain-containing protein n=1 Tax=Thermobifida halotolerans TaxID=483545 RepID=A0A399FW07_9ACTN|nr:DGQHR domain-containing protein DpdB [Thermobifida halotolerans]UOE21086.1 DGQHR domain-containing protein [Thermobifida halotolerans]